MTGERRIVAGLPDGGVDSPIVSNPRSGFDNTGFQTPGTPNVPSALDLNAFADAGQIWVVADWTAPTLNSAGQITQWAIETLKDGDALPFIEIANADREPPHRISNLEPNTLYHISVRALTAQGASSVALTGSVTTGHDTTVPPTLSGFAGGAGYTTVTLTWTALGTVLLPWPGKYFIEQALDSGFTTSLVSYDNGDSNVATIGKLVTGTTYYFRVHARSASGIDGLVSSVLSFTPGVAEAAYMPSDGSTPSVTTPAPTVTGGPGYLFVKWAAITNADAVIYEVHVSTSSGFTPSSATKSTEVVGSNTTGANSAFLKKTGAGTDLAYGTNYYVKIYPKDRDGYTTAGPSPQTGPTQLVQVTTADIVVGAITAASGIIASLDAGTITTGTLDASGITVTNLSAAALVSGNISASVGFLGTLTAGQITSGTLDASVVNVTHLDAANIDAGTMNAVRIGAGTIGAVLIQLASGGTIRNAGFSSGVSGWQIDGAGNTEVNNLVARGSLTTTATGSNEKITIGGVAGNQVTFYTGSGSETAPAKLQVLNGGLVSLYGANFGSGTTRIDLYQSIFEVLINSTTYFHVDTTSTTVTGGFAMSGNMAFGGGYNGYVCVSSAGVNTIDTNWGMQVYHDGTPIYETNLRYFSDGSTTRVCGIIDGRLPAYVAYADTNSNWVVPSTKASKKNIRYVSHKAGPGVDVVESSLAKLRRFRPARYNLAGDKTNDEKLSFVMEDVQPIFPEAVSKPMTGVYSTIGPDGKETIQQIPLGGLIQATLIASLVHSVQELDDTVAGLQAQVAALSHPGKP